MRAEEVRAGRRPAGRPRAVVRAGVDEIACLVDFGAPESARVVPCHPRQSFVSFSVVLS